MMTAWGTLGLGVVTDWKRKFGRVLWLVWWRFVWATLGWRGWKRELFGVVMPLRGGNWTLVL
jgi:hypothetical protein